MKNHLYELIAVLSMAVACLVACNLDFNEAIPCENDLQCPEGMFCEQVDHQCMTGSALEDSTGDTADTGGDQVTQDLGDTTSDQPTEVGLDQSGTDVSEDAQDQNVPEAVE